MQSSSRNTRGATCSDHRTPTPRELGAMKALSFILLLPSLIYTSMSYGQAVPVPESAWQRFEAYRSSLASNDAIAPDEEFFSQRVIDEFKSLSPEQTQNRIWDLLRFPLWLAEIFDYHYITAADSICLSINGMTSDNKAMTISLEYINEKNRLVINDIHTVYLKTPDQLPSHAICPSEAFDWLMKQDW